MNKPTDITVTITDRFFTLDLPIDDQKLIASVFLGLAQYVKKGSTIKVKGEYSIGIGLNTKSYPYWEITQDNTMAIMGGRVGINTTAPQRELQVKGAIRIEPSSAPTSPAAGDMYYDSTANKLRVYDGTTWKDCY